MAMLQIRCWRAKKYYQIDSDMLPETVYREAIILGLRELLNRGMSNVKHPTEPEFYDKLARENIKNILVGEIRYSRQPISE